MDSLSLLPENGIPSDFQTIATDSTGNSEISDDAATGEIADIDHADKVYTNDTETSSFLPNTRNDQLEVNATRNTIFADVPSP